DRAVGLVAPGEPLLGDRARDRDLADRPGVLGVRLRPGVRLAAAHLPHLVLGRTLRALQGLFSSDDGVRRSTRGEGSRRGSARVTITASRTIRTCRRERHLVAADETDRAVSSVTPGKNRQEGPNASIVERGYFLLG